MLELCWFFGLSGVGFFLGFTTWNRKSDKMVRECGTFALMAFAMLFGWPLVGHGLYIWLSESMPQTGTFINEFTAFTLTAAAAILYAFCPMFWMFLFSDDEGNLSIKNFILIRAARQTISMKNV